VLACVAQHPELGEELDVGDAATVENLRSWLANKYGETVGAGRLDVQVRGAEALLAAAGAALDAADAAPADVEAVTAARLAVAAARAACGDAALEVATAIFDFSGASAADRDHGLDRHWRNARTHTLHDPTRSKHHHLGRHLVAGDAPPVDHPLL